MRCRNIARPFEPSLSSQAFRAKSFERVTPHAILPEPDRPDSGQAARVNVAWGNYSVESGIAAEAGP
jgi:hypothetical protein